MFSPVQFQANQLLDQGLVNGEEPITETGGRNSLLKSVGNVLNRLFHPNDVR